MDLKDWLKCSRFGVLSFGAGKLVTENDEFLKIRLDSKSRSPSASRKELKRHPEDFCCLDNNGSASLSLR